MEPLYWSLLLLALGVGLLVLELFIPSGGILGAFAALSFIAAIWVGYTDSVMVGTSVLLATLIAIPVVIVGGLKIWPHTPIGRLILGKGPDSPDEVLPQTEAYRGLSKLVGRHGTAKSKMLPSGHISIDGRSYDAITAGMAIEVGEPVRVVDVRTNRLVVRPATDESIDEITAPLNEDGDPLSLPIDSLGLDDPLA